MIIDSDAAVNLFFNAFGDINLPPCFYPYYICMDSKRGTDVEPMFFVYEDGGDVFYHGFSVGKVPDKIYFDVQSPYGYGGPLATTRNSKFLRAAWAAYSLWCRENKILVEFIRFHPIADNWRFYNGTIISDRQTVWIDLKCDDLLMSYKVRSRTAIRKAYKEGLIVEWVQGQQAAACFEKMYSETMKRLNAKMSYCFPSGYFNSLFAWNRTYIAICKKGNEVVAMSVFLLGNGIMEYHLSATTEIGRRYAATNLVIHEAAMFAQQKGCLKLHLGGGLNNEDDNPLWFFKSGFSPNYAMFKIGKLVHNQEVYDSLRKDYGCDNAALNKILFYKQ